MCKREEKSKKKKRRKEKDQKRVCLPSKECDKAYKQVCLSAKERNKASAQIRCLFHCNQATVSPCVGVTPSIVSVRSFCVCSSFGYTNPTHRFVCVCSIGFLTHLGAFALILISFGFLPLVTISHSFGCFRLTSTKPPTTNLPFAFSLGFSPP